MIKVALYSPEPVLIAGMQSVLATADDIHLVAVCPTIPDLMRDIQLVRPDLVLLQSTPEITFGALKELKTVAVSTAVVLWVRSVTTEFVSHAIALGVRGILSKRLPMEIQLKCLRKVAAGEFWLEYALTEGLLFSKQVPLTPREREIIGLVVHGMKNKEVAESTGLAVGTVKVYLSRIFEKLGARGRFDLALRSLDGLKGVMPDAAVVQPAVADPLPSRQPSDRLVSGTTSGWRRATRAYPAWRAE